MASPIRNACVARGSIPAGVTSAIYTVPAGYVLLLKHVLWSPSSPNPYTAQAFFGIPSQSPLVKAHDEAAGANAVVSWELWTALNGGDTLYLRSDGSGASFWVAGALLPFADRLDPNPTTAGDMRGTTIGATRGYTIEEVVPN